MKLRHWIQGAVGLVAAVLLVAGYFWLLAVLPPWVAVVLSLTPFVGLGLWGAASIAKSHEELSALRAQIKARESRNAR
jgi:ABC-type uncharacterized transport system permease subunit